MSKMISLSLFIFIFIFILISPTLSSPPPTPSQPSIGITYTSRGTHLPHQSLLIPILQSLKITSVRLPQADPDIIRSFSFSGISLLLSIPNTLIPELASNQSKALRWLNHHVTPFYPRVHITTISVGNNDVLDSSTPPSNHSHFLLPAINNVNRALHELGIDKISVSTTFSFANVITTAFPPSSAKFQESVAESLMKPLLDFLAESKSPFLINLYPYNLYRMDSEIPIGYAVFEQGPFNFRDDLLSGVRYRNLFDMMVDSVITSMALLGHEDVPLVVTETGWPSFDESKEVDANPVYAEMYVKGLVKHLRSGLGTPLKRDGIVGTYIFELFDEDPKEVSDSKLLMQWGIMYTNTTLKFHINFSSAVRRGEFTGLWSMLIVCWVVLMVLMVQ
ncbi:hypothetical protein IFM89_028082 [Coptis chinensis]|uniref:Glucan endo-1,3-beta-D-glucosidase n=1 Tax=Coptis chinensis TaxID=261450 RepID=A0A835HDM9_9MAGN|nr:hypothetical protein IFM89_028082 [Coptis chinensis]